MTGAEMLTEITGYFSQGKYPEPVLNRMRRVIETISDAERQIVLDHLIENNKASFKVSVAEIVEACKALGVAYTEAKYIPATAWCCDACGHQFRYTVAASDADKLDRDLFDACPMCGFQPYWTKLRDVYKTSGAWSVESEAQYQRTAQACRDRWGPGKPDGLFWARAKAEEDRRRDRRINVEAKLERIDRAKHFAEQPA